MNTVDVLIAARALIEKPENWAQGINARLSSPPHCAGAALIKAKTGERLEDDALAAAFQALRPAISGDIVQWNDTPGRTHSEVLAAFDKAIAAEQAKQAAS